jgi:hypothetical protein
MMKRTIFVRKSKIQDLDRSIDLKYWQAKTPAARLSTLEEIRQEYHHWKYSAGPGFQRVFKIVKR